jgi:hypothetical protein
MLVRRIINRSHHPALDRVTQIRQIVVKALALNDAKLLHHIFQISMIDADDEMFAQEAISQMDKIID